MTGRRLGNEDNEKVRKLEREVLLFPGERLVRRPNQPELTRAPPSA